MIPFDVIYATVYPLSHMRSLFWLGKFVYTMIQSTSLEQSLITDDHEQSRILIVANGFPFFTCHCCFVNLYACCNRIYVLASDAKFKVCTLEMENCVTLIILKILWTSMTHQVIFFK